LRNNFYCIICKSSAPLNSKKEHITDNHVQAALERASRTNDANHMKLLLFQFPSISLNLLNSLIYEAASKGFYESLKILLEHNIPPNSKKIVQTFKYT